MVQPTIDITFLANTGVTTCKIQAFKANFNDLNNVTHLKVNSLYDDLSSYCILGWNLLTDTGSSLSSGNMTMGGTNYSNWTGDNITPFNYVGTQLQLTFI